MNYYLIVFNKNCIVLIDEYNTPIFEAIQELDSDIHRIVNFIRKFISDLLKGKPFVDKSITSACTPIRLAGVNSSDLNNIEHWILYKQNFFKILWIYRRSKIQCLLKKINLENQVKIIGTIYSNSYIWMYCVHNYYK